ncbi:hypothetical protein DENSPDRAFT_842536 [Dentipellis sp. KUC8613]|nr:hypothetical protein DENSPDRAFT_842536 [Dentipellis sp. KUC8613]
MQMGLRLTLAGRYIVCLGFLTPRGLTFPWTTITCVTPSPLVSGMFTFFRTLWHRPSSASATPSLGIEKNDQSAVATIEELSTTCPEVPPAVTTASTGTSSGSDTQHASVASKLHGMLPRNAHARNLKTKSHKQLLLGKNVSTSQFPIVIPPGASTTLFVRTNEDKKDTRLASRGSTLPVFNSTPRARSSPIPNARFCVSTPTLSLTAESPTFSESSTGPSTPRTPTLNLISPQWDDDLELGSLAKRRGFRGGKIFTASKESLRAVSSSLSPLSPLFPSGPALRRVSSSLLGRSSATLPMSPIATGLEDGEDPFAMHGDSYYALISKDAPTGDIYDFSIYQEDAPRKGTRRNSRGSSYSRVFKPRSKLNIYDASVDIVKSTSTSAAAPASSRSAPSPDKKTSPSLSAPGRDAHAKPREVAETSKMVYQMDAAVMQSTPVLPTIIMTPFSLDLAPLTRSASSASSKGPTHARKSTAEIKAAETLRDRDFLRAVARAQFSPPAAAPVTDKRASYSSVSSIFSDRRRSGGIRPLVLPQQLARRSIAANGIGQTEPKNESAVRKREHAAEEKRRSGPLLSTMTI